MKDEVARLCAQTINDGSLTLAPITPTEALAALGFLIDQESERVQDDYPMDDVSDGAIEARQGLRALHLAHALLSVSAKSDMV